MKSAKKLSDRGGLANYLVTYYRLMRTFLSFSRFWTAAALHGKLREGLRETASRIPKAPISCQWLSPTVTSRRPFWNLNDIPTYWTLQVILFLLTTLRPTRCPC